MKNKRQPTALDVLKRVKSILTRRGWVQGYYATNKRGDSVVIESEAAVAYCLSGARFRAEMELQVGRSESQKARTLIEKCVPERRSPEAFNDSITTKKKDVIVVVNCAIQKAQRT